mmetsp:Transcript_5157/g.7861  ORF Transcript_5157/g.7861 Transcript_5157/m.7861 type:complete len:263 (+) Transcript_5157:59-847(+)
MENEISQMSKGVGGLKVSAGKACRGKKGKNKGKKEEKKRKMQERQDFNNELWERLNNALYEDNVTRVPRDVLVGFEPFAVYKRNGLDLGIEMFARDNLPQDVREFCFGLTETNMKDHYETSGWGWNPVKKKRELGAEEARILVAFDNANERQPVAFAHFRFLREDDALVLYVYELQVSQDKISRKGVGRHLMMIMELVARKYKMEWVMLTVLDCNKAASNFYKRIKYSVDETSPQFDAFDVHQDTPYQILSKKLFQDPKPSA